MFSTSIEFAAACRLQRSSSDDYAVHEALLEGLRRSRTIPSAHWRVYKLSKIHDVWYGKQSVAASEFAREVEMDLRHERATWESQFAGDDFPRTFPPMLTQHPPSVTQAYLQWATGGRAFLLATAVHRRLLQSMEYAQAQLSVLSYHPVDLYHPTLLAALSAGNERWQPFLQAAVNGCWWFALFENTIVWCPTPDYLRTDERGRLHNEHGPAFQCLDWPFYYWKGTEVPGDLVLRPETITTESIVRERNVEVRRVAIERYGAERFVKEMGAETIHEDETGKLLRCEIPGDEPLVFVAVVNSTPEPDGSYKDYWLRVPPTMQRARQAIAWTFQMNEKDYHPQFES